MATNYGSVILEKNPEGGYALRVKGPYSGQEHWLHFDSLEQLDDFADAIQNAVVGAMVDFDEQQKVQA